MSETGFDPRFDVPETDEQVTLCVEQYQDGVYKESIIVLYRAYREQGHDVISAWKKTLLVAVGDKEEADKITMGDQENAL